MPSVFTPVLGLELQADGENDNTWGQKANRVFEMLEDALCESYTVNTTGGTTNLGMAQGSTSGSEARNFFIRVTGSLSSNATVTVPNGTKKLYLVENATTGGSFTVTFKTVSGTGVAVPRGSKAYLYADGTNVISSVISSTGLESLAGLAVTADTLPYGSGTNTYSLTPLTSFARTLLDDANNTAARTTLGLGTIATQNSSNVTITGGSISGITDLSVADGGTGASTASAARTNLGLTIGTDVQAYNALLQAIAGLSMVADRYIYGTGSNAVALGTITSFARTLLDDANAAAARDTLGINGAIDARAGVGKQTIWVPASAMTPRATGGPSVAVVERANNNVMEVGLDFDPNAHEYAQFTVAMPKSWNGGPFQVQAIWTAHSGSGNVIFGVQALARGDGEGIDAGWGVVREVTDTLQTTGAVHITAFTADVTPSGTPAANDIIWFQIYRAGSSSGDTLGADARLLGVRITYTTTAGTDD